MTAAHRRVARPAGVPAGSTDWMDYAACQDIDDPEIFFPLPSQGAAAAKAVCARCPVRVTCLEDALAKNNIYGFRGGMSGEARRRELAKRNREAAPA